MSDENYWCMHVSLDFLHSQEAVRGLGFLPHHVMLQPKVKVHVVNFRQASGRGDSDESLRTKQLSSITRSMKNFQEEVFRADVDNIPCHVANIFDDSDDIYWAHTQLFQSVLNEHAPVQTKWIKKDQVPYMNSELRKAIHQRNM